MPIDNKKLTDLIGLIYDAATDPERWRDFLDALATHHIPSRAALLFFDLATPEPCQHIVTANYDPSWVERYFKHYAATDVAARNLRKFSGGQVMSSLDLCPLSELKPTEFYNDFMQPQRLIAGPVAVIAREETRSMMISALQPGTEPREEHLDLMRLLMPHLRRAMQMHRQFAGQAVRGNSLEAAFDTLASGILLLDEFRSVVFVNRMARNLLARNDGLTVRSGRLGAATTSEADALGAAVASVLNGGRGGVVAISRPSMLRPFPVMIAPLPRQHGLFGPAGARVAVFVRDPDAEGPTDTAVLASLYGLTQAEARVAIDLAAGKSVDEIAAGTGVSLNTVRSQLKSVFTKTETRRQGELVSLLLRSIPDVAQR